MSEIEQLQLMIQSVTFGPAHKALLEAIVSEAEQAGKTDFESTLAIDGLGSRVSEAIACEKGTVYRFTFTNCSSASVNEVECKPEEEGSWRTRPALF